MNVSWPGGLALQAGEGKVHLWTKSKFTENGKSATMESMSCGSILPDVMTTAIAGNGKILPEIPNAAWDNAKMPKFPGTAMKEGSALTINAGVALVGLTMTDPTAAWPDYDKITGADHDGDTSTGVTAIPKSGSGYILPPTSIAQSKRVDKIYLATRTIMTLSATAEGCPQTYNGTANVTKFENHVIGCHVQGGNDCTGSETEFVDSNRTVFTVKSGTTFSSKVVPDNATCADVRTALPVQ